MTLWLVLKWVHVVSATVLMGTGAGIAFFFIRAVRTQDARVIAAVARDVVLADTVFTAVAVVVQPLTGIALARVAGVPLTTAWIALSLGLYALVGACWLPVVWLQVRMRDIATIAAREGMPLPPTFNVMVRIWSALGVPAFAGVLLILWLMVAKPAL
ncbi:MAG: DUF2269 domain-containing protein [Proteobacteria bacterium]|nr:DUF2269 domain-containing protein [Pseudomonadota bacterium]